ncbi:MAG: hypothetical protein Q8922_00935 [Bacteroidota bacterium]|nr:hypothetical protein [Bacteroidota bacterium]MDP4232598.1 hypothetical protein [Bacteroidota bacterium]MDP4242948.1 hypothetical protein [Bacteroidota bacterium]MDP4286477.1 hypothetical protein [Bacteroidota bacterium]
MIHSTLRAKTAFRVARRNYYGIQTPGKHNPFEAMVFFSFDKSEIDITTENLFIEFQQKLFEETAGTSRFRDILINQHYRWMVSLGEPLVPILLRELALDPSPIWATLLFDINRINPVPPEERQDFRKVVGRWREWGYKEKYLRDDREGPRHAQGSVEAISTTN